MGNQVMRLNLGALILVCACGVMGQAGAEDAGSQVGGQGRGGQWLMAQAGSATDASAAQRAAALRAASQSLAPAQRDQSRQLFDIAVQLFQSGDFDAAKLAFERGLAIDAGNGQARYYFAETLVRLKLNQQAREQYELAQALVPNTAEGLKAEAALAKLPKITTPSPGAMAVMTGVRPPTSNWAPGRPVRVVVPFVAGGPADVVARLLGSKLSASFGQLAIVDNRAGAGGLIGADIVAKSAADGYHLLSTHDFVLTVAPNMYSRAPFGLADFSPVVGFFQMPYVLVVPPSSNVAVQELILQSLRYGSAGVGTVSHLIAEKFKALTGAPWLHVPFKGSAPMIIALQQGELAGAFLQVSIASSFVSSGKVKAVAIAGSQRHPAMPDVPTLNELGVSGMEGTEDLYVLMAPRGTPDHVIARYYHESVRAVQSPDLRERINALALDPIDLPPQGLAMVLQQKSKMWGDVIRKAGISIQ